MRPPRGTPASKLRSKYLLVCVSNIPSCGSDANDAVGCIISQNLIVLDATAEEIDAAVAGVSAGGNAGSGTSGNAGDANGTDCTAVPVTVTVTAAASPTPTPDATTTSTSAAAAVTTAPPTAYVCSSYARQD